MGSLTMINLIVNFVPSKYSLRSLLLINCCHWQQLQKVVNALSPHALAMVTAAVTLPHKNIINKVSRVLKLPCCNFNYIKVAIMHSKCKIMCNSMQMNSFYYNYPASNSRINNPNTIVIARL